MATTYAVTQGTIDAWYGVREQARKLADEASLALRDAEVAFNAALLTKQASLIERALGTWRECRRLDTEARKAFDDAAAKHAAVVSEYCAIRGWRH